MFVAASPVRLPKACVAVVGDTPRGDFEGGAAQVSRRSSSVPLRDANSSIVADFSIGALSDLLDWSTHLRTDLDRLLIPGR